MVPLPTLKVRLTQVLHRHALEHHAGGLFVADVVRQLDRAVGIEHALGRVAAERPDIGDAVADFEVGHAGADCDHFAGALVAGDERHRRRRITAVAEIAVDEIDAGGMRFDLDLALAWRRDGDVLESQNFGTAGFMNAHCRDHGFTPFDNFDCLDSFGPRS